jgi:hypothetical protein
VIGGQLEPTSRRSFFKQAGTVAAVAGAVVVAPVGVASALAGTTTPVSVGDEPMLAMSERLAEGDTLIAHLKDAKTGEISLFVGDREVVIKDKSVAARLIRATR